MSLCECGCGLETSIDKANNATRGLVAGQSRKFVHGHSSRERWKNKIVNGSKACSKCGIWKPVTAEFFHNQTHRLSGLHSQCKDCLNAKDEVRRRRLEQDPEFVRKRCEYRKAHRLDNLERERAKKRKCELKLKLEMISAYGGVCSCCGQVGHEFLTLEHINHDGVEHRKAYGNGAAIWRDLKRRGWPKDAYTVLCWNCNCNTESRVGRPCPHKIDRTSVTLTP